MALSSANCCFSLCFTVISSSATEEVKKLTGTEGGSITLPDPVVEEGFLSFEGKTVAMVFHREIRIYEDKVLWNNSTGLFTITGLQRNDSGIYKIDSKTGRVSITTYHLTVYGESYFLPFVIIFYQFLPVIMVPQMSSKCIKSTCLITV